MTDQELSNRLRKLHLAVDCRIAADRIEELVNERDDAEWVEVLRKTYQRAKEAEVKLAKAVEALNLISQMHGYTSRQLSNIARAVLAELEETE